MTTVERIIIAEEFEELTASIQEHEYSYPDNGEDAKVYSPRFAVAKLPKERMYALNGESIYDLVSSAIEKLYPHFESSYRTMFCDAIPGYLEKPMVMLEYLPDKQQRDYVVGKVLTPAERALVDSSCTRATNIRNMYNVLYVISVNYTVSPEFKRMKDTFLKQYNNQIRQTDDVIRELNAVKTRSIVYNFCIKLIKKASQ